MEPAANMFPALSLITALPDAPKLSTVCQLLIPPELLRTYQPVPMAKRFPFESGAKPIGWTLPPGDGRKSSIVAHEAPPLLLFLTIQCPSEELLNVLSPRPTTYKFPKASPRMPEATAPFLGSNKYEST